MWIEEKNKYTQNPPHPKVYLVYSLPGFYICLMCSRDASYVLQSARSTDTRQLLSLLLALDWQLLCASLSASLVSTLLGFFWSLMPALLQRVGTSPSCYSP